LIRPILIPTNHTPPVRWSIKNLTYIDVYSDALISLTPEFTTFENA